jgi:2-polyprenyl-3-methyl-5-hydroxy-6-metoxy-1,4-benzoquinol methylase
MTDPLIETDYRDASRSNSQRFTDTHAAAAWDFGAVEWDQFLESGADYYRHEVHGPALLAAAEPLGGRMVLDIGCGQGYFSRLLAKRGGRVIAIDVSGELIALATSREQREQLGIEYRLRSASRTAIGCRTSSS